MESDRGKSSRRECLTKFYDLAAQKQMRSSVLNKEYMGSRVLSLDTSAGASSGKGNNLFRASVSHFIFIATAYVMHLYVVTMRFCKYWKSTNLRSTFYYFVFSMHCKSIYE